MSGTLQDARGEPTADYTIIVFPSENRSGPPQSRRIGGVAARHRWQVHDSAGLPAGQYRMTAVTDAEPGEWFDPDFLRSWSARRSR